MKKERLINIEILRIIAMVFVVLLHYLGKGSTLLAWGDPAFGVNTWIAWGLESFALVAVNVYVIISGYFLVESDFKINRIIKLWFQIFFYSAGIWLLFLALGMVPADYSGGYWISMFLLPVTSGHYWFASTYIFMCLIAPFLSVAARKMSKRQLQTCIVVLLILFSRVWRIVLPMSTPIDDRGYGVFWFATLFMIAAYIRLYVPKTGNWIKPFLIYVISSVLLFLSLPALGTITVFVGKMEKYYRVFFEYNAPFTIIGAIALFLAFRNMNIRAEKLGKVIRLISGATFGVYLIHEHTLLRSMWSGVWKVQEYYQTDYFVPHCIAVVACVFVVGILIDLIRRLLFAGITKIFRLEKIGKKISAVDKFFNNKAEEK